MIVPFLDLTAGTAELRDALDAAMARVMSSGRYIGGAEVTGFEQAFAGFCGTAQCVGVSNGLDALRLALMAMEVRPGDEVIVPAHTFVATWLAVSQTGATIVPVDPAEGQFTIDADGIAAALTPRTRAVIPVHIYGMPCDMDPIMALAQEHRLWVLEDAAQAHGALYRGQRIGGHGHAAAWSFYPGKNLGAFGDAGAVTTNDPALAARMRRIGNYGAEEKYKHLEQGLNARLDPLQAALLRVKLDHLEAWNARRARIAARYDAELPGDLLRLPHMPNWAQSSWHLYVVRAAERDALARHLAQDGIETIQHYPIPCHAQAAYAGDQWPALPRADALAQEVLSLPIGPHQTDAQTDRVIASLHRFFAT
ncbi:dTDP-4-amino-4,6-dideoxygalactose transaminase [Rubricella aquisinus]|uniref:dTDP-4-amino-4,6-dideoxygalactose transaminase n=1 Tax=Rubricella aquisinus TaxID=2028108 RepID=A0A840WYZ7_9RHOB|nr:DegT/DnrJ/EryC1/StrS family aminotransferase [Rubricella aquisinus]MBB5515634.1 dTDP-4-amino-4,6-dideoxygalactose transaminase [Rubricella aquisinus]